MRGVRWDASAARRACLFLGLTGLILWTALLLPRPLEHPKPGIQEEHPRRKLQMVPTGQAQSSQECLVLGPVSLPDQKLLFTATWAGSGTDIGVLAANASCEQTRDGGVATALPPIHIETSSAGQAYFLCNGRQEEGLSVRLAGLRCGLGEPTEVPWNDAVYSAKIDKEGVYVWAKGPYFSKHLKPGVPCNVSCSYYEPLRKELLEREPTTCGQEVVLCPSLPQWSGGEGEGRPLWVMSLKIEGIQLPSAAAVDARDSTVYSSVSNGVPRGQLAAAPSAEDPGQEGAAKTHSLCACTMIYNSAAFIPEWAWYHHRIGVEQFFFYDNNSDDSTEEVILGLVQNGIPATKIPWPWPKAQQGGFSHCVLTARRVCKWIMFADVDEYMYPAKLVRHSPGADYDTELRATSRAMLQRFLRSEVVEAEQRYELEASGEQGEAKRHAACRRVGQVAVPCLVFGPSGHRRPQRAGMTFSYTCRLRHRERHKAFVLADALLPPLLSVVHNFVGFQEGFCTVAVKLNSSAFFHYKYPAWDDFKRKFYRRAASYAVDWKENRSLVSRDRTPGLGTVEEKPSDWEEQFCEVPDRRMQTLVLRLFPPLSRGFSGKRRNVPWHAFSVGVLNRTA